MSLPIPLSNENAHRIFALPPIQIVPYLPLILERIRRHAPRDGIFVELFVGRLNKAIDQRGHEDPFSLSGWDVLEKAYVDAGIMDVYIHLIQHPRDDYQPALFHAMDTLCSLIHTANPQQRKVLVDKAKACDAMNVCLNVAKNGELCMHRYGVARLLRALCAELTYGATISATETATVLEALLRLAYEDRDNYSTELLDPDKTWQVTVMVSRIETDTTTASRYGKRWFGLSQELLLWAAQALLCRWPIPSRQYVLEIVEARPQIIDLLLDIANLKREDWYPESNADSIALETLSMLYQFPIRIVPGLNPPVTGLVKESREADWKSTVAATNILISRPDWLTKICTILKKLDSETPQNIQRQFARVHKDWYGEPPPIDSVESTFMMRGELRICALRLIEMATYAENIKDGDLLSLLRIAYVATQSCLALDKDRPASDSLVEACALLERLEDIWRIPMNEAYVNISPRDFKYDAPSHIPSQRIGAPTALLRLLVVLAERGILEKARSWTQLPEGCAAGTDIQQVKQIMSQSVLKKLLHLVTKRITDSREKIRLMVDEEPWRARARYAELAYLGATVLAFDRATAGRLKESIHGVKKEVVLCLGNAAEMSVRRQDFDAALGFAMCADVVSQTADRDDGITEDIISKNKRRIQTAQEGLNLVSLDI